MCIQVWKAAWLRQQACDEDSEDSYRTDISDKEPEHAENLYVAAKGSSVGEFIIDIGLLESPADKQDSKKAAESHKDVG